MAFDGNSKILRKKRFTVAWLWKDVPQTAPILSRLAAKACRCFFFFEALLIFFFLIKDCARVMTPVTFNSPNSYIPVYEWSGSPRLDSFSIDFQTNERYGVLAYMLGAENDNNMNNPNAYNKLTSQIQSKLL